MAYQFYFSYFSLGKQVCWFLASTLNKLNIFASVIVKLECCVIESWKTT